MYYYSITHFSKKIINTLVFGLNPSKRDLITVSALLIEMKQLMKLKSSNDMMTRASNKYNLFPTVANMIRVASAARRLIHDTGFSTTTLIIIL